MSLEVTIHSVGAGTCSLTGKDCDGLTVSFNDGTLQEGFLSQKGFMQLVKMRLRPSSASQKTSHIASSSDAMTTINGR